MTQAAVDHYIQAFNEWPLHASFSEARQTALDEFKQKGFPTLRDEDWRYTDIGPITKRNFKAEVPEAKDADLDLSSVNKLNTLDCDRIVFLNGRYIAALSKVDQSNDGITIKPLIEVLETNSNQITENFNVLARIKNAFASLNTAFLAEGVLIQAPDNRQLVKPVHLIYVSDKKAEPGVAHLRNFIAIGKHARATVIESYIGINEAENLTNSMTEVNISEGGSLTHYKLQEESQKGFHIGNFHAELDRDSRLDAHSFSFGGSLVRNQVDIKLNNTGAHTTLNGLYVGNGRQHIDNHTCINHASPHTTSIEEYRGILNGRAQGVFNGKVIVQQDAQKTDAQQYNANLLLSDHVEIDTKPELEIYADDVKCSHGATVGQLDENMLFYLRSRALDEDTARSLLTFAFADEVVSRADIPEIRSHLETRIVGKLPDADLIQEFVK